MKADANAIEPFRTERKQQIWMLEHMLSVAGASLSAEGMRSSSADFTSTHTRILTQSDFCKVEPYRDRQSKLHVFVH